MASGFTARPRSAPERAEPDTVQPKDEVELSDEDFALDHDEISHAAYGYWLERRDRELAGSAEEDWIRAEQDVRRRKREQRASEGEKGPTL